MANVLLDAALLKKTTVVCLDSVYQLSFISIFNSLTFRVRVLRP